MYFYLTMKRIEKRCLNNRPVEINVFPPHSTILLKPLQKEIVKKNIWGNVFERKRLGQNKEARHNRRTESCVKEGWLRGKVVLSRPSFIESHLSALRIDWNLFLVIVWQYKAFIILRLFVTLWKIQVFFAPVDPRRFSHRRSHKLIRDGGSSIYMSNERHFLMTEQFGHMKKNCYENKNDEIEINVCF